MGHCMGGEADSPGIDATLAFGTASAPLTGGLVDRHQLISHPKAAPRGCPLLAGLPDIGLLGWSAHRLIADARAVTTAVRGQAGTRWSERYTRTRPISDIRRR
jgi:hypothetical protein